MQNMCNTLISGRTECKIVKEVTGHISDAVNKYQTMSEAQRNEVSKIIQGDVPKISLAEAPPMQVVEEPKVKSKEEIFKLDRLVIPKCSKNSKEGDKNQDEMNQMVVSIIEAAVNSIGTRQAKVTVEVELLD